MPDIRSYLQLIKFSHTIFAMPFALVGFALGWVAVQETASATEGSSWFWKALCVLGCMVFARSSAMAFNRYLDRDIDALNPRTAQREIPAGIVAARQAWLFTLINAVLFLACAFFINRICFYLSPVALTVILGYSYTKRFTPLCHLVLGLGLSFSVIGAYLAVTGAFALLPIVLSGAVLTWVSGFDILYAMQDESFDRTHRLHSMPAWLGGARALRISSVLHFLTICCLFFAGIWADLGSWYWLGAFGFTGLLIYQHALVTPDDLSRVDLAFMTTNGIGSVVFSLFVILELFYS